MGEASFIPYTLSSFQGVGIIRTYLVRRLHLLFGAWIELKWALEWVGWVGS